MNELALFAGAGGGILGGKLLGWTTVCAVELERYPRECLLQRQRDGVLPEFPIWDDVCTFDGKPWRGLVDVVSGGFPCQDISSAGKGAGITGTRSGLWAEMHRIVCEIRPRYVFVENSPALTSRGLGRVLGDLAASGYDAAWLVLGAADVGAPHRRDRIWILATEAEREDVFSHADLRGFQLQNKSCTGEAEVSGVGVCCVSNAAHAHRTRCAQTPPQRPDSQAGRAEPGGIGHVPNAHLPGCEEQRGSCSAEEEYPAAECGLWWGAEPRVGRVVDGVAHRVDRLRALGNGQVPLVAAVAFTVLRKRLIGG